MEETATKAVETLSAILKLKVQLEKEIQEKLGRRSSSGLKLLNYLFENPVINVKAVEAACGVSTKTANELVTAFEENKWLKQLNESPRYRTFAFELYLNLFE